MAKKKTQPRALSPTQVAELMREWRESPLRAQILADENDFDYIGKHWPGLFSCIKLSGKWRAALDWKLHLRCIELLTPAGWVNDSLLRTLIIEAGTMAEHGAKPDGALAQLFDSLIHRPKNERQNGADDAKRLLCAVVDELANLPRKHHGSKITVRIAGHEQPVPLAYAAIEHARRLVEMHQRLPTKIEVQRSMEDAFPDLIHLSKSAWPKVWKEAGLVTLPMGEYGTGNVPLGSRK